MKVLKLWGGLVVLWYRLKYRLHHLHRPPGIRRWGLVRNIRVRGGGGSGRMNRHGRLIRCSRRIRGVWPRRGGGGVGGGPIIQSSVLEVRVLRNPADTSLKAPLGSLGLEVCILLGGQHLGWLTCDLDLYVVRRLELRGRGNPIVGGIDLSLVGRYVAPRCCLGVLWRLTRTGRHL